MWDRVNKLCELNVIEQVVNVSQTTIVQGAWDRNQELSVHGWIYGLKDGLIKDLRMVVSGNKELSDVYPAAHAKDRKRKVLGNKADMKVAIIGGGGRVGSCAAYALQCGGLVSEIQILDANKDLAEGEALDLLHGSAFAGDQQIYAGDYNRAADNDIFLITAGLRRKPDESRLDLINRNVALFVQIVDSIKAPGLRKDAHIFVVSNPVDILTQLALQRTGLPWNQVYGLGTMLDTSRFSSLIADELKLAPTQVKALILGEHGDSMLPVWSSATVNGLPLAGLPECSPWFSERGLRTDQGQWSGSD